MFAMPPISPTRFALPTQDDVLSGLEQADSSLDTFTSNLRNGRFGSAQIRKAGISRDLDHRQFVLLIAHHANAHALLVSALTVDHEEIADCYLGRFMEIADIMKIYKRSRPLMRAALLSVLATFETKALLSQVDTSEKH